MAVKASPETIREMKKTFPIPFVTLNELVVVLSRECLQHPTGTTLRQHNSIC